MWRRKKKKKKECPNCGKDLKLSKKDRALRKMVGLQAMIFPALQEACDKAKDYCNDCWKMSVLPAAQGIAIQTGAVSPGGFENGEEEEDLSED